MYKIVLECLDVPDDLGEIAANNITAEFAQHRRHHTKVGCSFTNGVLTLVSENDFDSNGLATMDEFSDCLCAYLPIGAGGDMRLKSATSDA